MTRLVLSIPTIASPYFPANTFDLDGQQVDMRRTGITLHGKDRLFAALENNRSLQELRLDNPSDRITKLLNSRYESRSPMRISDAASIRSGYR